MTDKSHPSGPELAAVRPPAGVPPTGGPPPFIPPQAGTGSPPRPPGGPPFPFPAPDPKDLIPLVIPPQNKEAGATTAAAFLLIPGALLYPKDYALLTEALQTAFASSPVPLWLLIAGVDWTKMNPTDYGAMQAMFDGAAEAALNAAIEQGFQVNALPQSGRCQNLFVGMHSMSALDAGGFALRRASGAVTLGGALFPSNTFWPSVHAYPHPLLEIFGELDGQSHQCRASLAAADAATMAPTMGRRYTAKYHPVALIQGMNHAQFSNGVVNAMRGDLQAESDQQNAVEEIAVLITAFLTANAPGSQTKVSTDDLSSANDLLEEATMKAARQLAPYARACGRISAEQLLTCSEGACTPIGCDPEECFLPHPLAYARGAEAIFHEYPSLAFIAHPGELYEAEKFAIRAQKRALEAALPEDIAAGVAVSAVAHTSIDTFVHSQPVVVSCPDAPAGVALRVHCLLQREAYPDVYPAGGADSNRQRNPTAAMSPVYALKLKSGEQVAAALGQTFLKSGAGVTGAQLSAEVFDEALVLIGTRGREIFQKRGYDIRFEDDIRSWSRGWEWVEAPLGIKTSASGAVAGGTAVSNSDLHGGRSSSPGPSGRSCTVSVPCLLTQALYEGPFDEGPARFSGALFVKCPSLAWAIEWIVVGGLRQR